MYHLYCFLVTFISCVCVTNNHNILAFSSTIWVLFSSFPNPKGTWKPLPTSAAPSSNACCRLYLCDLCSFNPKCRCDWQIIRLHFTELSCIVPSAALEEACVGLSALSSLLFPLLFNTLIISWRAQDSRAPFRSYGCYMLWWIKMNLCRVLFVEWHASCL